MGGFQIVALPVLGVLLIVTISATIGRKVGRRVGFFWSIVWVLAGLAVAWPGSTSFVAKKFFGIGRGADLVLYSFCVLMLVGFFMTYTRLRRLDTAITQLTRHLALQGAEWPESGQTRQASGSADEAE